MTHEHDTVVVSNGRDNSAVGLIVGVLVVIIIIAAIWFFALGPGAGQRGGGGGGTQDQPAATQPAVELPSQAPSY
jgi:hypothetical protein